MTQYYTANGTGGGTPGIDTNSGLSSLLPWLTVAKNNGFAFVAVDNPTFNRSDEWRESFLIARDGSSGSPITVGAYGTGAQPKFSGATLLASGDFTQGGGSEETGGVFASGLEDEVDAFTTDFTGKTVANSNTVTVVTAAGQFNNGIKGGKIDFAGTGITGYAYKDFADQTTCYARAYIKFNAAFETATSLGIFTVLKLRDETAGIDLFHVQIQADNAAPFNSWKWSVTATNPTALIYNGTLGEIVLDQWYQIELKFVQGTGANGIAEFKLDGVVKGTTATAQTWSTRTVDRFLIGHSFGAQFPNAASEMNFDDVKVDTAPIGAFNAPTTTTNRWYATAATEPTDVYRDGVAATEVALKADLDTTSEFWPDAPNGRLYLYDNTGNPATNDVVEIPDLTRSNGLIFLNTRSYYTVKNQHLTHGRFYGIRCHNGSGARSNLLFDGLLCDEMEDEAAAACYQVTRSGAATWDVIEFRNCTAAPPSRRYPSGSAQEWGWNLDGRGSTSYGITNVVCEYCSTTTPAGEDAFTFWHVNEVRITRCYPAAGNGENSFDFKDTAGITAEDWTAVNDGEYGFIVHEVDSAPNGLSTGHLIQRGLITGAGQKGVNKWGLAFWWSKNSVIRDLVIRDCPDGGAWLDDHGAAAANNQFLYCTIDCPNAASAQLAISNNIGTKVYHCTLIAGATGRGLWVIGGASATGINARNNIIKGSGAKLVEVAVAAQAALVLDYTGYYSSTGYTGMFTWGVTTYNTFADWKTASSKDANSPTPADPLLVDEAGNDYRLQAASPFRDLAVAIPGVNDGLGDLGAFEFVGAPPTRFATFSRRLRTA